MLSIKESARIFRCWVDSAGHESQKVEKEFRFRKASRVERTAEELDNVIRSAKSSFNPIDIDNHRDNAVTG